MQTCTEQRRLGNPEAVPMALTSVSALTVLSTVRCIIQQ